MKTGQRLGSKTVSRKKVVTDEPYSGEAKEVIGGYWFIVAGSLEEAARIAAGNPCLNCGLFYEDPAHRPGAGHRLHGDERDPKRTQRPTMRAHESDGLAV